MFRDREEALQELQKQLLDEDEEDLTEEEYDEEEDEEYDGDDLPEEVYDAYSKNVRAYNSDATDADLDAYSQAIYKEPRRKTGCTLWFALATAALLLALSYFLAKQGGLL